MSGPLPPLRHVIATAIAAYFIAMGLAGGWHSGRVLARDLFDPWRRFR